MKKTLLLACLSMAISYAFAQNGDKLLKPSDVLRMSSLSNPQVSPDAKWVAYSLSVVDTAKDGRVSHLWMQTIDGSESIELSYGGDPASNPRWSPDNKYLAYLSSRDSKNGSQVWLMDRRGGEGKKLTDIKGDINDISWSPDARKMLLVIKDPENKGKAEPKTPAPIVIDRYNFKHDVDGYLQHLHTHLYVLDIETKKLDTLTKGDFDEEQPSWSPDGSKIAFVSNRTGEAEKNDNTDIYSIEARPDGAIKQLTTWKGHDVDPQWSPDGKAIAYLRSTSDVQYIMYDQDVLCLMDADGGNNRTITLAMDRPVSNPIWCINGKNLAFIVYDDRKAYLAQYNVQSGKVGTLAKGEYAIQDIDDIPGGGDRWMVQLSTPHLPPELFVAENGGLRRVTFHQKWIEEMKLPYVQGFESKSKDGTKVSGILYTPDSTKKKLPFILYIHGGPVDQDDYSFDDTRLVLASAGYAVAAVNYRGSNGRGLAYCKAIYGDWGHKEEIDLLGAVDELIKRGVADPNKLGIGGWSYGAISTEYTIATDPRFKAAIAGAGSALQTSMYGSDQYVLQYETEVGVPWKNQKKWNDLSYPFWHADKIKTPIMFLSGLRDFNVPTAGSEQMYEAMKSLGIPTQLVLYPNQFHGITVPSYQVDRLQRYLDWYAKYLK